MVWGHVAICSEGWDCQGPMARGMGEPTVISPRKQQPVICPQNWPASSLSSIGLYQSAFIVLYSPVQTRRSAWPFMKTFPNWIFYLISGPRQLLPIQACSHLSPNPTILNDLTHPPTSTLKPSTSQAQCTVTVKYSGQTWSLELLLPGGSEGSP